jgi:peptide/nickel transport system substrate-binding protein
MCLAAAAQQTTKKSDAELAREGALALAAAHGEKPRYGGKFLSAGNEEIPFYDLHQTSLGGIYAAVAPAYNCLVRTSPYDPMAMDIIPELADTWEISDGGKTLTFHLHKGVKWHDGTPFSSADVQYTVERIMNPPKGMVSPRGPVFAAIIERVEAPDPDTTCQVSTYETVHSPSPPARGRDPDRGLMADFCHHVDDSWRRGHRDPG